VKVFRRFGILLLGVVSLLMGQALATEGPRGLLLRKGLVNWQVTLNEARTFIEENVHPRTLRLLRNQKEEGFRCEGEDVQGVSHCVWACCVDLGEKEIVHSPYPARAGCATAAGSRRTRWAPPGRVPVFS